MYVCMYVCMYILHVSTTFVYVCNVFHWTFGLTAYVSMVAFSLVGEKVNIFIYDDDDDDDNNNNNSIVSLLDWLITIQVDVEPSSSSSSSSLSPWSPLL